MDYIERSIQIAKEFSDAGSWWLAPKELLMTFSDIEWIWECALVDAGYPQAKNAGSLVHTLVNYGNADAARFGGVEGMLEAYFEGVPVEDILPYAAGGWRIWDGIAETDDDIAFQ